MLCTSFISLLLPIVHITPNKDDLLYRSFGKYRKNRIMVKIPCAMVVASSLSNIFALIPHHQGKE
jgi:hypothetical protein